MKIAIIDDDPSISVLLSEILKIWNHDVKNFTSPTEAIKAIEDNPVDLVFTDYIMDELSGKDIYEKVKVISENIKVVITTALNRDTVIEESGCETILEKPFKMADVKELLESLN